jgi:hypothetical protein
MDRTSRIARWIAAGSWLVLTACGGRVIDGSGGERGGAPNAGDRGAPPNAGDHGSAPTGGLVASDPGQPDGGVLEAGATVSAPNPSSVPAPPPTTLPPWASTPCPPMLAGAPCSLSPAMACATGEPLVDCDGQPRALGACACWNGRWACTTPGPPSCADAAAPSDSPGAPPCPDPTTIISGVTGCPAAGELCLGNPRRCGVAASYDVFQCEGFIWVPVTVGGTCADAG